MAEGLIQIAVRFLRPHTTIIERIEACSPGITADDIVKKMTNLEFLPAGSNLEPRRLLTAGGRQMRSDCVSDDQESRVPEDESLSRRDRP